MTSILDRLEAAVVKYGDQALMYFVVLGSVAALTAFVFETLFLYY